VRGRTDRVLTAKFSLKRLKIKIKLDLGDKIEKYRTERL